MQGRDFNLVSSERLMARIQDELSTYSANGLLDTGRLYSQLKWFATNLGLAVYGYDELVINLNNYRAELPCNFYLLDSAWLCENNWRNSGQFDGCGTGADGQVLNFQAKSQVYTERICEDVINPGNCSLSPTANSIYPVSVNACVQDKVLNRTTTREYVASNPNNEYNRTWHNPRLLRLNNKKSIRQMCSGRCANMFSHYPEEISISMQNGSYYLYSTLQHPTIYIKYYAYPIDAESGLPLVPEDAILQEALYWHLVHYFIQGLFINGEDNNLENKLKYLTQKREESLGAALSYIKLPSYNTMIEMGRRVRNKWNSYEVLQTYHY